MFALRGLVNFILYSLLTLTTLQAEVLYGRIGSTNLAIGTYKVCFEMHRDRSSHLATGHVLHFLCILS